MQGMTMKLMPEKVTTAGSIEALSRNLFEVYRFRSINDPDVFKDVNTSRLLGNYRACVMTLSEAYKDEGRLDDLAHLLRWAEDTVDLGWQGLYTASEHYRDAGRADLAVEFLHRAGVELTEEYGKHPSATYENGLALGSILLNNHRAVEKAEDIYRKTIALEPSRYDGVHELAATLQAGNRPDEAMEVVLTYMSNHGETQEAINDRQVLQNSLDRREANAVTPVDTADASTNQSGAEDTGGS
jgi:tetratricopeptide (TPR) repeat protein